MSSSTAQLSAIAASLAGALPGCRDASLALALVRQLARGEPVSPAALAAATTRDEAEVVAALSGWPTLERDDQQRVVAACGLTLRPTPHRFEVGGRELSAWCAWDTLFLPALLGEPARVRSRCPVTGVEVRLTVAPDGVHDSAPAPLHVSFPRPGTASSDDIAGSLCRHVHFLAGPDAAQRWLAGHRGAVVLSLRDAFELGRLATSCCRGAG